MGTRTVNEVSVSMVQIYMEQIHDMLVELKDMGYANLKQRETKGKGVYIENALFLPAKSSEEMKQLIENGKTNMLILQTNMSQASSRKYIVIQLVLKQTTFDEEGKLEHERNSTINLTEMAGSERIQL